jgi:origin recognition complex subunit 5
MLPDELLQQLTDTFPCRENQIKQLAALYSVSGPPVRLPISLTPI